MDGSQRIYAIDVPDVNQVPGVYAVLANLEERGAWEFEEGRYAGKDAP
jgi:CO/xanthine dehydrogenase Mo-binding subunit